MDAHLVCDDIRERRFAEARRAEEQDMIEGLSAHFCGADHDPEALPDGVLTDVFRKGLRPEGSFDPLVLLGEAGFNHALFHGSVFFPLLKQYI